MPADTPCGRGGVRTALALLAAMVLSGCPASRSCGNEPESARRAVSVTKEAPQPAAEKLPLDPFERRAALDAAYRLKPDRRILLAVEAVQRFFVAGAPGSATAVQEGKRWRIRLGPQAAERLVEDENPRLRTLPRSGQESKWDARRLV